MRRLTLFTLSMLLFLTSIGFVQAAETERTGKFKDIKDNHWARSQIELAALQGYVSGYPDGTFGPSRYITRAEFASLMARVSKLTATLSSTDVFADVKDGHWAKSAIEKAVSMGLIDPTDYSNGFKVSEPLTRYEMVKWMVSGLAVADSSFKDALSDTKDTLVPFTEYYKGGIAKEKIPYVAVARGTELSLGFPDGSFGFDKPTTRAEVAVVVQKYLALEGSKAEEYVGLTEMRDVGTTGTNMMVFGAKIGTSIEGKPEFFENVVNKPIKTNKNGTLIIHRFIVVDASKELKDKVNGVYGSMFVNSESKRHSKVYSAFVEVSYTSGISDMNNLGFLSEVDGITGSFLRDNVDDYGLITPPDSNAKSFYLKGEERRFWTKVIIDRNLYYWTDVQTKDGSTAAFLFN